MKNYKKIIVGSLMTALIITSPLATFANDDNKEKENKGNKVKVEQFREENEGSNNGNEKNKGKSFMSKFSDWMKQYRNESENKQKEIKNLTSPIISNITITFVKKNKATLNWTTDTKSNTAVWVSTVSPVNTTLKANNSRKAKVLNHKIEVKKLQANTKYYVIVGSTNEAGLTKSTEISFTTPEKIINDTPIVVVADMTAPAISDIKTTVSGKDVLIAWTTDEPATSSIFYGTNTPINTNASTTATITDESLVKNHSLSIPGLANSTLYHFILKSADALKNVVISSESTFTTN